MYAGLNICVDFIDNLEALDLYQKGEEITVRAHSHFRSHN